MIKGNVTISRVSSNVGGDYINIVVNDEASGKCIVEVKMIPKEFAEAVTGLAHSPCEIKRVIPEEMVKNIGKDRITKHVECFRVWDKEEQERIVDEHFEKFQTTSPFEWHLLNKGLGTQQRGDVHRYVVYRFKGE